MISDLAALASLFLLATVLPIYFDDPNRVVGVLQGPALALTAIAVGIGGFLSLVGSVIWNALTPDRGGFRSRLAPESL